MRRANSAGRLDQMWHSSDDFGGSSGSSGQGTPKLLRENSGDSSHTRAATIGGTQRRPLDISNTIRPEYEAKRRPLIKALLRRSRESLDDEEERAVADLDGNYGLPSRDEGGPMESTSLLAQGGTSVEQYTKRYNSGFSAGGRSSNSARSPARAEGGRDLEAVPKRGVQFSRELEKVEIYEVDNSVYITIEYSRPVIGWLLLFISVMLSLLSTSAYTYFQVTGVQSYVAGTWVALGQLTLALTIVIFYFPVAPVDSFLFLLTRKGMIHVLGLALLRSATIVAQLASTHMTGTTRSYTLSCVHPLIITAFGKVFRNTLYQEELIGSLVLFAGNATAMFPLDLLLTTTRLLFAEVVNLSEGIYIASFLFLATKVRARVSAPLLFLFTMIVQTLVQLAVTSVTEAGAAFSADPKNGIVGFYNQENLGCWLVAVSCSGFSLLGYFMTLRFLPPITLSVVIALRPVLQLYVDYLCFFSPTPLFPIPAAELDSGLLATTRAMVSSPDKVFGPTTSIGVVLCILAVGYMLYISSIKRAKVDMLLKSLSKRKVPRNPFRRKGSNLSDGRRSPDAAPIGVVREALGLPEDAPLPPKSPLRQPMGGNQTPTGGLGSMRTNAMMGVSPSGRQPTPMSSTILQGPGGASQGGSADELRTPMLSTSDIPTVGRSASVGARTPVSGGQDSTLSVPQTFVASAQPSPMDDYYDEYES